MHGLQVRALDLEGRKPFPKRERGFGAIASCCDVTVGFEPATWTNFSISLVAFKHWLCPALERIRASPCADKISHGWPVFPRGRPLINPYPLTDLQAGRILKLRSCMTNVIPHKPISMTRVPNSRLMVHGSILYPFVYPRFNVAVNTFPHFHGSKWQKSQSNAADSKLVPPPNISYYSNPLIFAFAHIPRS